MVRRSCPVPATRRPPWQQLRAAITAPVARYLSRQAARPHGPVGRLIARNWVRETAAVNDTAVDLLAPQAGQRIAEIGFGPGRTLARLAAVGAEVLGVDASADMVAVATRRNAAHVNAGRIRLHHGDGTLPTGDGTLDGVLSVHSLYFWPDPAVVLAEIRRTLRPGGRLVLAFRGGEHPRPARFDPTVYQIPTTTEAVGWLNDAGFTNVAVHHRPRTATIVWITSTAP
jgi:SAM-dependent methyltransferase